MVVGAWRRKGVIVRPLGGRYLPTHIRVSIKALPENERFIEALRAGCCRMMGCHHMRFPEVVVQSSHEACFKANVGKRAVIEFRIMNERNSRADPPHPDPLPQWGEGSIINQRS